MHVRVSKRSLFNHSAIRHHHGNCAEGKGRRWRDLPRVIRDERLTADLSGSEAYQNDKLLYHLLSSK